MVRKIFVLLVLLLFAGTAHALTEKEYSRLCENCPEFKAEDQKMAYYWKELMTAANSNAKKRLLVDQRKWVKTGRDHYARLLMEKKGFTREDAYTRVTHMRANVLRCLLDNERLSDADRERGAVRADDYYNASEEDYIDLEELEKSS